MKTKNIWSRLLFTPIFINYVNHAGVYETVWGYPHVIVNLPNFKVITVSKKFFYFVSFYEKSETKCAIVIAINFNANIHTVL